MKVALIYLRTNVLDGPQCVTLPVLATNLEVQRDLQVFGSGFSSRLRISLKRLEQASSL